MPEPSRDQCRFALATLSAILHFQGPPLPADLCGGAAGIARRAAGHRGASSNYPRGLVEMGQGDTLNREDPIYRASVRANMVAARLADSSAGLDEAELYQLQRARRVQRIERGEARRAARRGR